MIETRAKCELLEQSLRVLAQENLKLERTTKKATKKQQGDESKTGMTGEATTSAVESSPKSSLDDDDVITDTAMSTATAIGTTEQLSDDSDMDEFFDMGRSFWG